MLYSSAPKINEFILFWFVRTKLKPDCIIFFKSYHSHKEYNTQFSLRSTYWFETVLDVEAFGKYEGVSKSFRTGRLARELQMV